MIVGRFRAKSVKIVFDEIALQVDLAHAKALKTVHPTQAWVRCKVARREAQRRVVRPTARGQEPISVRTEIDDTTIFGKDNSAADGLDEGGNFGDPDAVGANSHPISTHGHDVTRYSGAVNVAPAPEEELHAKAVRRLADWISVASHGRGDPKEELRLEGKARRVRRGHAPVARYPIAARSKCSLLQKRRS